MSEMNYKDFYRKMCESGMLSDHWKHLLELVAGEIKNCSEKDKSNILKLFLLYFSLIEEGNVYMSLAKEVLRKKIVERIDHLRIQYLEDAEKEEENETTGEAPISEIDLQAGASEESREITLLGEIQNELEEIFSAIDQLKALPMIVEESLFVVKDNRLFTKKYWNAVKSIQESIKRIFGVDPVVNGDPSDPSDLQKLYDLFRLTLTKGQDEIVQKGLDRNLLVTGGPGTGKTTSIFYLLLALLQNNQSYNVYLTAPSGKAASRMKDSILNCIGYKKGDLGELNQTVEKIQGLEEYTIHRMLGIDYSNHGFLYNKKNPFPASSIFVIDEASMIDVCVFAALLEAIPEGARVFVLGDKDQLPSVECGAVFGELLEREDLQDHIVKLTESRRFPSDSKVYILADAINDDGKVLPVKQEDWAEGKDFQVLTAKKEEDTDQKKADGESASEKAQEKEKRKNPVYYYRDEKTPGKKLFDIIAGKWCSAFYNDLSKNCTNLVFDENTLLGKVKSGSPENPSETGESETAERTLDYINELAEKSRILCANREGQRGVKHINKVIIERLNKDSDKYTDYYPGELLMITRNNDPLNLYNGDNGVVVTFKGDDTFYLMFKKSTKLNLADVDNETKVNKIFQLGDYVFYPLRLISREDIEPAFAITIHKSQGSDYNNILVILPERKGHPLLSRQIVYTAVTRTKGDTYIVSNQDNLECAKENKITRDTGIN